MKKSKTPNPKAIVCEFLENSPIKLPSRNNSVKHQGKLLEKPVIQVTPHVKLPIRNSNAQQQVKLPQKPVAHVIPRKSNEISFSVNKNGQASSSVGSRSINQTQINSATTDFRCMNISNPKPFPTSDSQRVHISQKSPTFKSQAPKQNPSNYKQPRPHIQNNINISNTVINVAPKKKYYHQKHREPNETSQLHKNKIPTSKSDGPSQNSGQTIRNQSKQTNQKCNRSKKCASNQSSTCFVVQNSSVGKSNIIVVQQNAGTTVCTITNQ